MKSTGMFLAMALTAMASACVAPEQLQTGRLHELDAVYPGQVAGIKRFFAEEAARAGVREIRAMTIGETPKRWSERQSGCAQTMFDERLILINRSRERCLDLDHLAHEIAHIGVLRNHCYGHGDRFYAYNRGIAERFESAFPDPARRGGWTDPVGSVARRAERYRVGAELCL